MAEEALEQESPHAAELEALRRDKEARDAAKAEKKAERQAAERKRGNNSWDPAMATVGKRDALAVRGIKNGLCEKDPGWYYSWVHKNRLENALSEGYQFASRSKLSLQPATEIPGLGTGTHPDQLWRGPNLVLMKRPMQHVEDEREAWRLRTDAQTPEMDEEALEAMANKTGLRKARPGHFGKGQFSTHLKQMKRKPREIERGS